LAIVSSVFCRRAVGLAHLGDSPYRPLAPCRKRLDSFNTIRLGGRNSGSYPCRNRIAEFPDLRFEGTGHGLARILAAPERRRKPFVASIRNAPRDAPEY
jgi:hypothetical protein